MKILALKWRRLGDTVLWTAALEALRSHYPRAEINIAFPEKYSEIFRNDSRWLHQYGLKDGILENLRLTKKLRSEHYDLALNFHASSRSLMFCLWLDAKEKIVHHHSRSPRRFFSDRPVVDLGKPLAADERDLNVIRTLGWRGSPPETRVFLAPHLKEQAMDSLEKLGWRREPLVILGVGASRPSKAWGMEKFAALSALLQKRAQVGVVYNPTEIAPPTGFPAGSLFLPTPTLTLLMGYLALTSCYVGSDSGVKHLARALGIPTLTLFGPESLGEWHRPSALHRAIQKKVSCRNQDPFPPEFSWCGEAICPYSSHACMSLITPEEVMTEVEFLL